MGIFSIFVINTVHYQPNKKYEVIMDCNIHHNLIGVGYNEQKKYKR